MKKTKVAVMNTSREIIEMLKEVIEQAGFDTCEAFTYRIKKGEIIFEEYVKKNKPDVILFDVAIPYEDNFELFKELAISDIAKNIPFILTTTNKEALEKIVGETNAYEIMGKPYDFNELTNIIKKKYEASLALKSVNQSDFN